MILDEMTIQNIYNVILLVSCSLSIYSVYKSNNKDSAQDGSKDGKIEADMENIKDTLTEIKDSLKTVDKKLDEKYEKMQTDFKDLSLSNQRLIENYKSLHKRVDDFNQRLLTVEQIINTRGAE